RMTPRALCERALPAGFRAPAGVAALLVVLGTSQLFALFFREEPFPFAAGLLALLLAAGGASLAAFVVLNVHEPGAADAARQPPGLLPAFALAALAAASLEVWRTTGTFFPLRMALGWRGALPLARIGEPALPMMLAGTCLVALGAVATAAVAGALWMILYARRVERCGRAAGAALSFAGAIPYIAFALVVRA